VADKELLDIQASLYMKVQFNKIVALAIRLFGKILNLLCLIFTKVQRLEIKDPTSILVDHLTTAQKRAVLERERKQNLSLDVGADRQKRRLVVLIPFRDKWELTHACLNSLLKQRLLNSLLELQISLVFIDNNSSDSRIPNLIKEQMTFAPSGFEWRYLQDHGSFNFSRINNDAVSSCAPSSIDFLLFLNNDVEFTTQTGLLEMVSLAMLMEDQVGAVGATLLFPDKRVQHLFVAPGIKIVAAHPGKFWAFDPKHQWYQKPQPVAAVTGAALLCRADRFLAVGGFDLNLPVQAQDVDLCLSLQKMNLTNWVASPTVLIHHESATRTPRFDPKEIQYIYQKWGSFLTDNPFYSSRFSRWSEEPCYGSIFGSYPWHLVLGNSKPR
jgi:GT2 family glycosyltransferase